MAGELPLLDVSAEPTPDRRGYLGVRIGAVCAIALTIGLAVWVFFINDSSSSDGTIPRANIVTVTAQGLGDLAAQVAHPVYWAGPIAGMSYELTKTKQGSVYVRYLPDGVEVGDPRPLYTTIGTYPQRNAHGVLKAASTRVGAHAYKTRSGALVVTNAKTPTSVYFAFKGSPYLVEVFNPSARKALQLTLSGQITPIS